MANNIQLPDSDDGSELFAFVGTYVHQHGYDETACKLLFETILRGMRVGSSEETAAIDAFGYQIMFEGLSGLSDLILEYYEAALLQAMKTGT